MYQKRAFNLKLKLAPYKDYYYDYLRNAYQRHIRKAYQIK